MSPEISLINSAREKLEVIRRLEEVLVLEVQKYLVTFEIEYLLLQ
jgi:hypothetical protein